MRYILTVQFCLVLKINSGSIKVILYLYLLGLVLISTWILRGNYLEKSI